jgi:hypothetical protein
MSVPEMSFPQSSSPDLAPLYISRLARLVRLRLELSDELNTLGAQLIDRAIESTVRDCVDHGAETRARALVDSLQGDGGSEAN